MAVNRELQALQARRAVQDQAARRQAILQAIAAQQGNGRGISIGPMAASRVQSQRAASAPRGGGGVDFKALLEQGRQQSGVSGKPSGGGGLFGNSLVKGVLTPLSAAMNVLDAPRRIVISGVNEAADALNGGDASFSDFTKQIGDQSFGFGDVVGETGNKWVDRVIGFAGDVALDPLTYATLGSSKFVGTAGRAALAGEAAAKGLGEDVVAKIARVGEHALTGAERKTLGLEKAGVRFGTAGHNVRIPITEGLSQALGKGVAGARGTLTDTVVGRAARRMGGSRVAATREFTERLATGKGAMSATDAANTVAALQAQKAAENMLKGRVKRVTNKTARELSGRGDITRAVEQGVAGAEHGRVSKLTEMIYDLQKSAGVDVQKRKNYVPHYNLPEFEAFLGRAPEADLVWGAPGSLGGGSGRLNPRVFKPNSDITVFGKKIHLDGADIGDIEKKFQAAFPAELGGKKLIEDDPGVWLPRLVLDAASDVGERGFEKRLMKGGSLRAVDDPTVLETVVDAPATKEANADFATRFAQDVKAHKERRAVMGREVNRRLAGAKGEWVDIAQAHVKRAQALHDAAQQDFAKFGRVADHFMAEADRLATEGEAELTRIQGQIDTLTAEAARLRSEATAARGEMNRARASGYRRRMSAIDAELAQLREQATLGAIAAQELDPVRKQFGRAVEKQTDLAAQVGEGPLGAARAEAGATLPQMAEKRFNTRVEMGLEDRADQLERLAQAKEIAADPTSIARMASEEVGGPVLPAKQLDREVTRRGGATLESREARVAEAASTGLTKPYSKALTPNDRLAAKRGLSAEKLVEPDILSDRVTNVNPPEIVQEFYDTQIALNDAMRPYRKSNLADDAAENVPQHTMATPEMNKRRQQLIADIEAHEQGIAEAAKRKNAGLDDPKRMDANIRRWQRKRGELMRELDRLQTVGLPRQVAAMGDQTIGELTDKASRLADFMVRYAHAFEKGGDTEGAKVFAARKALESERKELMERLSMRLPAEVGQAAEAGAERTRQTAALFELEKNVNLLLEPKRAAEARLIEFRRAMGEGKVGKTGRLRADVAEMVANGGNVQAIESQLKTAAYEEGEQFARNMSDLLGKRVSYAEAMRIVKGGNRSGLQSMEQALSEMTPKARALFDRHLKEVSVLDNRRLRDVNERLARMGEESGQREVTDMWQEVLTATPKGLVEGGTMKPRDLSQLTDPAALADIEAQRAALKGAKGTLKTNVEEAQQALLPADLPQMQEAAFRQEVANIASGNQTARVENSRRVGALGENKAALQGEVVAGRAARDELRAATPDQRMAQRLEEELAPHRAGIEATQEAAGDVDALTSALHQGYEQVDQKVQSDLSATTAMYDAARGGQITSAVEITQTRDMVEQATANLKNVKAVPVNKVAARTGAKVTPAAAYQQAVNQADLALRAGAPKEVVQLLDSAARIAADMVPQDVRVATAEKMLKAARSNKFVEMTKDVILPGFIQYSSKVAGENFVMRSELKTALDNMNRIVFQDPSGLMKILDSYTKFFKAYATATPGFHVRNALSAAFMNAADGVSFINQHAGARIWTAWEKRGVTHPDTWMNELPARYRAIADDVVKAVYGSGAGGQFEAAEIGMRAFGGRSGKLKRFANENLWMKGSQRSGEYVEGVARAGMAVDSLLGKGVSSGSFEEAVTRINRIHFNYSDVGEMDQAMRQIIPFWTFLSRNVPLQIQQMVTQPRSYLHYQSFVRNFSEGLEQDDLPEYMRVGGAFRITPGLALMPDIGATQLTSAMNQLTSPSRMMAQSNPILKSLGQITTDRNFFRGSNYGKDEYARVKGDLSPFGPLYEMLGISKDIPGGGQAIHQKFADATRDILPPLGVLNRLGLFGTAEGREGLEGQSWANWAGLPIKQLPPSVLQREQKRRRGDKEATSAEQEALRKVLAGL